MTPRLAEVYGLFRSRPARAVVIGYGPSSNGLVKSNDLSSLYLDDVEVGGFRAAEDVITISSQR